MIVNQGLEIVTRNLNFWSKSYGWPLSFHGQQKGAAAWGVGNCLVTVREVDPQRVEVDLVAFRRTLLEWDVTLTCNNIGKKFLEVGWIPAFDQALPSDWDLAAAQFAYELQAAWGEPLKQYAQNPAQFEADYKTGARQNYQPVARFIDVDQEVERSWSNYLRQLEAAGAELQARAAVANKTAGEAAQEYFAMLSVAPQDRPSLHEALLLTGSQILQIVNISGGTHIAAQRDVIIDGDVTGRDKIEG